MILDLLFAFLVANIAAEALWPAIGVGWSVADTFVVLGLLRILGLKLELYGHTLSGAKGNESVISGVFTAIASFFREVGGLSKQIYGGDTSRNVFIMVFTLIAVILLQQA